MILVCLNCIDLKKLLVYNMRELKLNCTLYFTVPAGKDPAQYAAELQDLDQTSMLEVVDDLGTNWDWESADVEAYDWQPV